MRRRQVSQTMLNVDEVCAQHNVFEVDILELFFVT